MNNNLLKKSSIYFSVLIFCIALVVGFNGFSQKNNGNAVLKQPTGVNVNVYDDYVSKQIKADKALEYTISNKNLGFREC